MIDRKIYLFWTGTNLMSQDRIKCLDSIRKNSKCEVVLVTPENLPDYILAEYPLHPAFEYLSLTHRADYLRCYFMYHYGGGYSDIKMIDYNWNEYFAIFDDSTIWAVGYSEIGPEGVALGSSNYNELCKNYFKLIGNGSYIIRKNTKLTKEWYDDVHSLLNYYYPLLKKFPAKSPQDILGKKSSNRIFRKLGIGQSQYPFRWTQLLGDIFHPIIYKHTSHVNKTLPKVNTSESYR